jgi:hypothetical protein
MKAKYFFALLIVAALLVGIFPLGEVFAHNNPGTGGLMVASPGAFAKNAPADSAIGIAVNPTLNWGTSNGTISYEYCFDTTNDSTCNGSWVSAGTNTSTTLTGLSTNTTYYWQVRAVNSSGTTYANNTLPYPPPDSTGIWWSFTTIVLPPGAFAKSAPANIATGIAINPTLSWGASNYAAGYEYCFDTTNDNACGGAWISTGMGTSVPLTGLSYNTTYYWQVRAANPGGITYANNTLPYPPPGSTGVWWSFTTIVLPPGPFAKSAPANATTGIVIHPTLSWGTSVRAASYEYCIDTTNDSVCGGTWISTGTNTSANLTGLAGYTTYYWQIRAVNSGGTTYADNTPPYPYPAPASTSASASTGTWWKFTTGFSMHKFFLPRIIR